MRREVSILKRRQHGQAVVIIVFMIVVIIGAVGLAVDGGIAYYYNASAERAAAAASLSGVVFMPYQFTPAQALPAGSGYDATDRALQAATRNGFPTTSGVACGATCTASGPNGITVTTSPITGADNKLQVTITRTVTTFFMGFWGLQTYNVSRTAIATYLPPIKLGQSGGQVGTTVSNLGTGGSNYYFMRTEGWATNRGQGDAMTPSPVGCAPPCPSSDYHQLSALAGTDTVDGSLPVEGGYNFMLTVPQGTAAQIQIYNAAFAPDGNVSGSNYCENLAPPAGPKCSPGGSYYMHEDDCCAFAYGTNTTYSAMKYTIYSAPSVFIRNTDTELSQMLVKPVDASCYKVPAAGCPLIQYKDVNTGNSVQQKYDVNGNPTNMSIYHSWVNVGGYIPDNTCVGVCVAGYEAETSLISYTPGKGPIGNLGPGTYRLRIDTLEFDGSNPCAAGAYPNCAGQSYAHKGYAVRVTDGGGVGICGGCTLSALDDMAIYTPVSIAAGGSFPLQIFQLPPDYAGQMISFEVFDAGDMSGSGSIYLGLVDPTTNNLVVEPSGGPTANVYDCNYQRSNYPSGCSSIGTYANPNGVEQIVTSGGSYLGDNKWYHYDVPIPSTYNPGSNPANWWWNLRYRTTGGVTATDTITITLNLKGNPAHLLQS
ncbi:MAG TPA: TadG family pilus assembly protein [Candidatus Dormibacteraeota bacterium]|nr:TadG family pilus assembly protein [Candidatus Dormibacteraeota bacterium]